MLTRHHLSHTDAADPERPPVALMIERAGRRVEFRLRAGNEWILLLVVKGQNASDPAVPLRLGLTRREVEVRVWVATILSIPPF